MYNKLIKEKFYFIIELLFLALSTVLFLRYLLFNYSLKPYSDPQIWYLFAKNFPHEFGTTQRAYGFPLVMYLASFLTGQIRVFLINIPLLCIMLITFYFIARKLGQNDGDNAWGWNILCGSIALAFLIKIDLKMLLYLANPYREPLAFSVMMGSMICLMTFVESKNHNIFILILSAILLAFSIAVRDTIILMAIPYSLFMLLAKLKNKDLPFKKTVIAGTLAFIITTTPQIIQNRIVSGSAIIPAQAAEDFEEKSSVTPGIKKEFFSSTFVGTVYFLKKQYGTGLILLAIVGVIAAIIKKREAPIILFAIGALIYFIFYSAYKQVMPRYLLVVDILAVPLMAYGTISIIKLITKILRFQQYGNISALLSSVIVFSFVSHFLASQKLPPSEGRFKMADLIKLRNDLSEIVPENAFLVGDRPLGEIARCFIPRKSAILEFIPPTRVLGDPSFFLYLEEKAEGRPIYCLCRKDSSAAVLRQQRDVILTKKFYADDYCLTDTLNRPNFYLYEIKQWTNTTFSKIIDLPTNSSEAVIAINMETLSSFPQRQVTKITLDKKIVETRPLDGWNYYLFKNPNKKKDISLEIMSDYPLPASFSTDIIPVDNFVFQLLFTTRTINEFGHLARFSGDFVSKPWPRSNYMGVHSNGCIIIPALHNDNNSCYAIRMTAGLYSEFPSNSCELEININHHQVYDSIFTTTPEDYSGSWRNISIMVPATIASNNQLPLTFNVSSVQVRGKVPWDSQIVLKKLESRRIIISDNLHINIGEKDDDWFLMDGFYEPEKIHNKLPFRWTGERARVNLPFQKNCSYNIIIKYFLEGRPVTLSAPTPLFYLNNTQINYDICYDTNGSIQSAKVLLKIPTNVLTNTINVLEIRSPVWIPANYGLGDDFRKLGIMLHSVTAERVR